MDFYRLNKNKKKTTDASFGAASAPEEWEEDMKAKVSHAYPPISHLKVNQKKKGNQNKKINVFE